MCCLCRRVCRGVLALLFMTLSVLAVAQNVTGSISGTVKDPSGALIPNATVTITNTDTNQVIRTVKTSGSGSYSTTALPLGGYTVTIEAPGFSKQTVTDIVLHVNDTLTINGTPKVGGEEVIAVTAGQQQLNLENATQAGLINGTQVRELVLSSRNYEQLVGLQPGVAYSGAD